jgi:hypothetical protein
VRRDEVLDYVRRTYGAERVALVATISTLRLRSALRETAKAHGIDEKADRPPGAPAARRLASRPAAAHAPDAGDGLAAVEAMCGCIR